MLSKTGEEQWNKAYNSPNKIEMKLVEESLEGDNGKKALGLANQNLVKNRLTGKISKGNGIMRIKISIPNIKESLQSKNKGLAFIEAVSVTAGHEIEHTTEENRDIGVHNETYPFAKKDIEKEPEREGKQIREELRNKPVDKIVNPFELKVESLTNN